MIVVSANNIKYKVILKCYFITDVQGEERNMDRTSIQLDGSKEPKWRACKPNLYKALILNIKKTTLIMATIYSTY